MARLVVLIALLAASTVRADDLTDSYTLEAKRDFAAAAKAMRRAATAGPKQYFTELRLGYLSAASGDHKSAAEAYAVAATLEPAAIEPLLGEQLALANLAEWPDAIAIGKKVIALDPASYLGRSRLAWALYKHKDLADAAELYRAVLRGYPGDVDMRLGLGWALLGAGNKADAARSFREVLAMVPHHASAAEGLAAAMK